MKIDLYNNHETFVKESRQDHAIDAWCSHLGLDRKRIENHPDISSIRTLLDLRGLWPRMNTHDQNIWNMVWRQVYEHEYTLSLWHKNKLLTIVDGIEYRDQRLEQSRIEYQARVLKRQKIKQRIKKREQKLAAV